MSRAPVLLEVAAISKINYVLHLSLSINLTFLALKANFVKF